MGCLVGSREKEGRPSPPRRECRRALQLAYRPGRWSAAIYRSYCILWEYRKGRCALRYIEEGQILYSSSHNRSVTPHQCDLSRACRGTNRSTGGAGPTCNLVYVATIFGRYQTMAWREKLSLRAYNKGICRRERRFWRFSQVSWIS